MTDDDLTPDQQEVRRLLADARHDEPMPDPVVARLDRVLTGLAEEPVREGPVKDLATRRRRATSLLVAAAAAIAIGVGVSQVVDDGTVSQDSLSTADRGDEDAAAGDSETAVEESDPVGDADGNEGASEEGSAAAPSESQQEPGRSTRGFGTLSRETYSQDVSALRDGAGGLDELPSVDRGAGDATSAAGATCLSDAWGEGTFVPVRYAGTPAVLVFRRATGDTQLADLFLCGDSEPRRSVKLPAP